MRLNVNHKHRELVCHVNELTENAERIIKILLHKFNVKQKPSENYFGCTYTINRL